MAAPKGRASGRKEKWKSKNWYNVMAPDMFKRAKIAEALSDEPEKLIDRVTEVTAQDVTGDFSKMHIKLRFKVNDVRGTDAHTYFIGHDMTSDYVRRMTRRRKSKIDTVVDVKTRDDFLIRIKPLAISGRRIRSSQQSAITVIMCKVITEFCQKKALDEVVKAIITGNLAKDVAVACKPIQPLQRVEIRKSEILRKGYISPAPEETEESEKEEKPTDGVPEEKPKKKTEPAEEEMPENAPKEMAPEEDEPSDEKEEASV
jgi:small subunit ribosomal protein S3Ae